MTRQRDFVWPRPEQAIRPYKRWLVAHVAEQARAMRRSVEEVRSQPAPSLLIASTGG
jgi:hypothetical protein